MTVDSEAWTCTRCGGQMIGNRTPGDLCRPCTAEALATPARKLTDDELLNALGQMLAELAQIDADYPGWHAWASDEGRCYASRALKPSAHNGGGELLDADTPAGLRELLKEWTA